jgi:hypothetical protein
MSYSAYGITPYLPTEHLDPEITPGAVAVAPLIQQADSEIRVRRLKSLLDEDQLNGDAFLVRVEAIRRRIEHSQAD